MSHVSGRVRVCCVIAICFVQSAEYLSFSSLLNRQFTTIVSAAGAYSVVDVVCAAVRADSQCGQLSYVMSTTFRLTGVRLSTFRMCHNYLQFNHLQFVRYTYYLIIRVPQCY